MAEAMLAEDSPVLESLLARVAYHVSSEHLEQFATTLLGMTHVKCRNIMFDAGQNSWKQNFSVSKTVLTLIVIFC